MTIAPFGANHTVLFHSVMKDLILFIDSDDNLYVAMYGQGRVLVFNKRGYPIGQILMPGRDEGKCCVLHIHNLFQVQINC